MSKSNALPFLFTWSLIAALVGAVMITIGVVGLLHHELDLEKFLGGGAALMLSIGLALLTMRLQTMTPEEHDAFRRSLEQDQKRVVDRYVDDAKNGRVH